MKPLTGRAADDRQAVVRAWHQPRPCGSALVRVRESGTLTCRGASTTYANPLLPYARIAPVEGKLGHTLALSPPSRVITVKPSGWARFTHRRRSVRSALSKGDVRRARVEGAKCRLKVRSVRIANRARQSSPRAYTEEVLARRRGRNELLATGPSRAMATTRSPSVSTTLLQHNPRHDQRVVRRADPSAGLDVRTEQPSVLGEAAKHDHSHDKRRDRCCSWALPQWFWSK